MALVYGRDGFALLEAVHAPDAPAWLREFPAVQILRALWVLLTGGRRNGLGSVRLSQRASPTQRALNCSNRGYSDITWRSDAELRSKARSRQ
ncbi:hypothetical protein QA860_25415 [Streptomyces stelliscabiei]|uniref:hypothetical protein n=1 Tax=Streptomyces stelliscabiei TaxID=146820 RepID=UPI002FF42D17